MTKYPKHYVSGSMPEKLVKLVHELLPILVDGSHPFHDALAKQLERAEIESIELTGCGFFANFRIPGDVPLAEPRNAAGGDAVIEIAGAKHGAGCVLYVRDGKLAFLEGYTYGSEEWAANAEIKSVGPILPIIPSDPD